MFDRITFDPQIMGGRASIRGMRIPVSVVVSQIAHGATVEEILDGYPDLTREDIQQTLEYAAWLTREQVRTAFHEGRWNGDMTLKPPFDRITIEADKMGGQPCIGGLRLTVRRVLEVMAAYPDRQELFREYPSIEEEDLRQALAFAAVNLDDRVDILELAS